MKTWHCYLIPLVAGVILTAGGLAHPYWIDEIVTMMNFASGWQSALLDYSAPNNHQLFSLAFYGWRQFLSPETLAFDYSITRLLPLFFFLAAVVGVAHLAFRRAGKIAALCAGLLFATAHSVLNFATELRGYAMSLPFALTAFYFLAEFLTTAKRRHLIGYLVSCWLLVGILPTNLIIPAALAIWAASEIWRQSGFAAVRARWKNLALIAFAPLAGLAILLPCYGQLAASIAQGVVSSREFLLWHYPAALGRDILFIAPVLIGAAFYRRSAAPANANETSFRADFSAPLFTLIVFLVPLLLCLLLPRVPGERVLVTATPLLFLGLGCWLAEAGGKIFANYKFAGGGDIIVVRERGVSRAGVLPRTRAGGVEFVGGLQRQPLRPRPELRRIC
ncbi:MAG: hypothetical protein LBP75_04770 [Planctomycetota bacterium]|jgi:hypothetical protein|nr:hypothetical protein [Planctomycetota bacterium]